MLYFFLILMVNILILSFFSVSVGLFILFWELLLVIIIIICFLFLLWFLSSVCLVKYKVCFVLVLFFGYFMLLIVWRMFCWVVYLLKLNILWGWLENNIILIWVNILDILNDIIIFLIKLRYCLKFFLFCVLMFLDLLRRNERLRFVWYIGNNEKRNDVSYWKLGVIFSYI